MVSESFSWCMDMLIWEGNAEGLGQVRRKELEKSALILGLQNKNDVIVLDDA